MKVEQDDLKLSTKNLEIYLKQYNIGQILQCNFIRKGLNYSYLVNSTLGKYIFRIYRKQWRSLEDILYEVDILKHISKYSTNISFPIHNLSRKYICEMLLNSEKYYGVLFSYAEGEIPCIDEDSSFTLGEILAEIHIYTDDFHSKYKRSYSIDLHHLIDEPMSYLDKVIEQYLPKESCEFIFNLANYIKNKLSKSDLEVGFCHGDLHDWNVHCRNNSYTVFDFDCCGIGFRAYDIAVFWWNLKVNYKEKEEVCFQAFKKGYLSKREICHNDMMAIPLFVTARRYWLAGVLLKNPDVFGTQWINEIGLTIFLNQLKDDVRALDGL